MSGSRIQCLQHVASAKCEAIAARLVADSDDRYAISTAMADAMWRFVRAAWGTRPFERFLERFDPCDCWRYGDPPLPTLERSVLFWHHAIREGKTAAELIAGKGWLREFCPVEKEWFRAMQAARVSLYRMVVVEGETVALVDDTTGEPYELATPLHDHWLRSANGMCVLTRIVTFRGQHFVSSEDQPRETFDGDDAVRIREVVAKATRGAGRAHPRFAWSLLEACDDIAGEKQRAELEAYDEELGNIEDDGDEPEKRN